MVSIGCDLEDHFLFLYRRAMESRVRRLSGKKRFHGLRRAKDDPIVHSLWTTAWPRLVRLGQFVQELRGQDQAGGLEHGVFTDRRSRGAASDAVFPSPVRARKTSLPFSALPNRRLLLAGTALVTSLIAAAPAPASAQVAVFRPLSPFSVTRHEPQRLHLPGDLRADQHDPSRRLHRFHQYVETSRPSAFSTAPFSR